MVMPAYLPATTRFFNLADMSVNAIGPSGGAAKGGTLAGPPQVVRV
jgi:hypothetical protein